MKQLWKLFFIPHEKNNHRAKILQPSFIGLFVALYLLNQSLIRSFTIIKPGVLGYSSEITIQKVFDQTNQMRQKNGLSALHYDSVLSRSATNKASDMFKYDYWAHNSPQGKTPWDFFKAEGYQYSIAGENLAKDFYDTDSMMKAWMNSPTHRENILNPKYQEIGIGVVNGILNGVKTTLVVQHFGAPLNGQVANDLPTGYLPPPSANAKVLSDVVNTAPVKTISPLQISQTVGAIMFIVIIGTLIIDAYYTFKNKTYRLAGSSAGHVGFLLLILFIVLASRQGVIF